MKKFFGVIGNPPYQEDLEGTSAKQIYPSFMDGSYDVGERVELITPARFLFNAGKTPKAWNQKMLDDPHLKVMFYDPSPNGVFQNTEIKGGVVVTYRDSQREYGAIGVFTAHEELNAILQKVAHSSREFLSELVYSPESYKFTEVMYQEHPEIRKMTTVFKGKEVPLISQGHDYDLTSNIFEKLENIVFFKAKPTDDKEYIQIFGRQNNSRELYYIDARYVAQHDNLNHYKLLFPKSNGSGQFGEVMSVPEIGNPGVGHTQTFLSMGAFDSAYEAQALMKYVQTRFARTMLGVLKVTQDNKKSVWKYVPLQNFTPSSDINWEMPISEIDRQLFSKYGLNASEIEFIEQNVKEMS